ncbi:MAG: galactose/methyl galactoside ABC transporter ATP-binding protein MglA [Firmicutes bacterium HGW-Firmicutes-7]|nr:MAG: galactose/methyl galactoside ABC transporter ATP-binding protein MglA [Firmicutes bacterium HGW-Firmicutes-7]
MDNKPFILEMKNMSKSFPGVKALDKAMLSVREGTVHALLGENGAGKSTLMKCLFGIYNEDEGEIVFNNKRLKVSSAKQALDQGISMVHQELNQVKDMRIMDNIWLGRFPRKGPFADEVKMYQDTAKIFKELDITLNPKQKVRSLSVSESQMTEIAKAVSYDSKIIVMDEPTSSLTEIEVNHLFRIIRSLKARGVGIIYISHKMEEIKEISDEVTIMRDGKYIATRKSNEVSTDEIISLMVGRDLTHRFPVKTNQPGEVIMTVENLTSLHQPSVIDVSFDLRKGEILGIAGLVGSRRTELLETIFGTRAKKSGVIYLHGKVIKNKFPKESIKNGFALVTEERRETGIFGVANIIFNAVIANLKRYVQPIKILNNKKMQEDTAWVINSMSVKTPSHKTRISSLSGGNQQKIILGRWLLTEPEVLLLDEPTRGIDVGAKFDIYELMIELGAKEKGVIMVSSEMPELLGVTDRILVMSNGRVAGIVNTNETNQEEILRLAAKYL